MTAEHSMIIADFVELHGGAFEVPKIGRDAVAREDGAPLANAIRNQKLTCTELENV